MSRIVGHLSRYCYILTLAVGFCFLGIATTEAATYDANADFAGSNPNRVWTYGWASTVGSLPSGLVLYTTYDTAPFGSSFQEWIDPNNNVMGTPLVFKNFDGYVNDGNIAIPAGALILHGGGTSGYDLSVVEFTAPASGLYSLAASFIGCQYWITSGHVYILHNGTIIFNNATIQTVGDTVTYSQILALYAGDKIDFVVGRDGGSVAPDCIELQATVDVCPCDLNHDGRCDMRDWLLFGQRWGATNCNTVPCACDLNHDGRCDMRDWLIFGHDWGRTDCSIIPQ